MIVEAVRLHVCGSCATPRERARGGLLPGARLVRALRGSDLGLGVELVPEGCLGPCDSPCASVIDLGAGGAYVATDLRERDAATLVATARGLRVGDPRMPLTLRRLRDGWR